MLYPLKFDPLYKARVWGGSRLREHYDRTCPDDRPIGESWEISGLEGDVSVVSTGSLAGNEINELIEVYMGELIGDRVYRTFGEEFPLLIKILDTKELLSIQVHPDDALAARRHGAYGKTEMWVVMEADPEAYLYLGFNKNVTEKEFLEHQKNHTLPEILNRVEPKPGEAWIVPAGTIHSIGPGLVLAEIQQSSDITYRIYDWDRKDAEGNSRELHTELALDTLNFNKSTGLKIEYRPEKNRAVLLQSCPQFTVNRIELDGRLERDYLNLDSFVIYQCLAGEVIVQCEGGAESLMGVETLLIPAEFESVTLSGQGTLLEIHMPFTSEQTTIDDRKKFFK
jgi:mannose-6-phosphate isomerase